MAERSMQTLLRSSVVPIAFVGALALLATRTCGTELATVHFRFELGAAEKDVDKLYVSVHRGDEQQDVAFFEQDYRSAPRARRVWTLQLDAGTYRLKFRVRTRTGTRHFERVAEVTDGATVVVNLERGLMAPGPTGPGDVR